VRSTTFLLLLLLLLCSQLNYIPGNAANGDGDIDDGNRLQELEEEED